MRGALSLPVVNYTLSVQQKFSVLCSHPLTFPNPSRRTPAFRIRRYPFPHRFPDTTEQKNGAPSKELRPVLSALYARQKNLFAFVAVAAGALLTVAGLPYMDFRKRAIVPFTVVLAARHIASDAGVYALHVLVHHIKNLLAHGNAQKKYVQSMARLLTFSENSCKINTEKRKEDKLMKVILKADVKGSGKKATSSKFPMALRRTFF